MKPHSDPIGLFWSKVIKSDACWGWKGGFNLGGYAIFRKNAARAHRFSWELHFGPIPPGLWVLHKCDNRKCVRPDHLFLGTARDNALDRNNKGRNANVRGERNPTAKLTYAQVADLRNTTQDMTKREIAQKFGISIRTVYRVLNKEHYP